MNARNRNAESDSTASALAPSTSAPAPAAAPAGKAAKTPPPAKPEKARSEPDVNPAIPRDEHHLQGGLYVLVDGQRVPCDENGKPLPPKTED
ncbi:hypothetical protein [Ramlibacter sp.]|uniref:hypothetical protein n=1 Tax=Ramlibacter sp. TaxID=1917967 RepID=UPI003D09645D